MFLKLFLKHAWEAIQVLLEIQAPPLTPGISLLSSSLRTYIFSNCPRLLLTKSWKLFLRLIYQTHGLHGQDGSVLKADMDLLSEVKCWWENNNFRSFQEASSGQRPELPLASKYPGPEKPTDWSRLCPHEPPSWYCYQRNVSPQGICMVLELALPEAQRPTELQSFCPHAWSIGSTCLNPLLCLRLSRPFQSFLPVL